MRKIKRVDHTVKPFISLGTAQFGLDYGITNKNGKLTRLSIQKILTRALDEGISSLDTAYSYGNAEGLIGDIGGSIKSNCFRVTSKIKRQETDAITEVDIKRLDREIFESLNRLKIQQFDTLLLHSTEDLRKPGSELLEGWLKGLKDRGHTKRIGVSIYAEREVKGIDIGLLDVIQAPVSLYDQRLIKSKGIRELTAAGTRIQGRSIFLQGLIVTPSQEWPQWAPKEIIEHHKSLEVFAKAKNISLHDCAIRFATSQSWLESIVVGVCNQDELEELITGWRNVPEIKDDEWSCWELNDSSIIDPRLWPL